MLTRLDLRGVTSGLAARLPRPAMAADLPVEAVRATLAAVRTGGDAAVRELTERFDGVSLEDPRVPPAALAAALAGLPPSLREALEEAVAAVRAYHRHQAGSDTSYERDGVFVRELRRPVDRAGVYVPGGRAPLLSSVVMTAVPARVAGVGEVVMCSPPGRDGRVPEGVLAAAALSRVDEVYAIGGAQAVGAMAYGTERIRPVDVIVGPGNVHVSVAKREVAQEGRVGVPSAFAGPSEVVVVADASTPAEWAALDVAVQAEHGPDGLAWLVTWSEEAADRIVEAVGKVVAASPRREDIERTLATGGYAVLVDGPQQAMDVVNLIAPEHLELMNEDPEALVPLARHVGAVFCGPWAPASVGDYLAGPSHVLPTYGSARFAGGLGVADFQKKVHVVTLDAPALARVAPYVAALAEAEGLPTHAESVRARSLG